jgi:GT2 family glycosyltransferase
MHVNSRILKGITSPSKERQIKMNHDIMMVTYNRLSLTKRTMEGLIRSTALPYRMIVVDNASTDGSTDWIQAFCENHNVPLILKRNKNNYGIAVGRNQCLARSSAEWLVTFDNDVLVPNGWLEECTEILKANRQYAAIGVNMEDAVYPIIKSGSLTFQDKPRGNLGTACMVFNRTLHKQLGYFNHRDYGLYGEEDADMGMRIRVLGMKLGYITRMGNHIGVGKHDAGQYRTFKTKQHTDNLKKFNENCVAYHRKQKSLYCTFEDTYE